MKRKWRKKRRDRLLSLVSSGTSHSSIDSFLFLLPDLGVKKYSRKEKVFFTHEFLWSFVRRSLFLKQDLRENSTRLSSLPFRFVAEEEKVAPFSILHCKTLQKNTRKGERRIQEKVKEEERINKRSSVYTTTEIASSAKQFIQVSQQKYRIEGWRGKTRNIRSD